MRLVYVDAGLKDEIGHHANCCRAVTAELRSRNVPTSIVGFTQMDERLKDELGALPLLRTYIYYLSDGDPLAGWLNAFEQVAKATREDMTRIENLHAGDIVYAASAYPGQLMGIVQWLSDMAPDRRPFVVVDLLSHPGIEVRPIQAGYHFLPRREDPRAMLYRYAANMISRHGIDRLVISYSDRVSAEIYSHVLGVPVTSMPLPFEASSVPRNRAGHRPIRLSLLGSQRNAEKGYHLVPEIVAGLLQSHPELRVHVHNSYPDNFPAATEAMRAMAQTESRITLDERAVDVTGWAHLLADADVVLCPYSPDIYQFMSSGVHAEAIANAIPTVVPANTVLARAQQEFGGAGSVFERFEPVSIMAATRRVLDRFDDYAERALTGAEKWRETRGPAKLVDAILALSRQNEKAENLTSGVSRS